MGISGSSGTPFSHLSNSLLKYSVFFPFVSLILPGMALKSLIIFLAGLLYIIVEFFFSSILFLYLLLFYVLLFHLFQALISSFPGPRFAAFSNRASLFSLSNSTLFWISVDSPCT